MPLLFRTESRGFRAYLAGTARRRAFIPSLVAGAAFLIADERNLGGVVAVAEIYAAIVGVLVVVGYLV